MKCQGNNLCIKEVVLKSLNAKIKVLILKGRKSQ